MKKNFYLYSIVLLSMFLSSQQAKAQQIDMMTDQVVWEGTTIADAVAASARGEYFYLIEFRNQLDENNPELFCSTGGEWGVQGTLTAVGMRLQVEKDGNYYYFKTRIKNTERVEGWWLGYDNQTLGKSIFFDRLKGDGQNNYTRWVVTDIALTKQNVRYNGEPETHTVPVNGITIRHNGNGGTNNQHYVGRNDGKVVTSDNATNWVIVSEQDYKDAMDKLTWGQVDLGAFLKDADFCRDNMDARFWVWSLPENPTTPAEIKTGTDAEGQTITLDFFDPSENLQHWHLRNQNFFVNGYFSGYGQPYDNDMPANNDNLFYNKRVPAADLGSALPGVGNENWNYHDIRQTFGQYYCGEIYNEAIKLSQKVELTDVKNLKEGLYKLSIQALYDDDENGTTNDNAFIFIQAITVMEDGSTDVHYEEIPIIAVNNIPENDDIVTRHSGLSAGYLFDEYPTAGLHDFYVEMKENTQLTIGIYTKEAKGWAAFGNVHFYAYGKQELFLDENWTEDTRVEVVKEGEPFFFEGDPYQFTGFLQRYYFPTTLYYRRTLTKDAWNPIVLPINITTAQLYSAFGTNTKVSEFVGLDNADDTVIKFTKTNDLDELGHLQANKPYLIKPSQDPFLPAGERITLPWGNGGLDQTVTVDGPIYLIGDVTKEQSGVRVVGDINHIADPDEAVCPNTGLIYTGSFYVKKIETDDIWGQNNFDGAHNHWVISKGNMYHLTGDKPYTIWATYCYIYDARDTFKNKELWTERWADNEANTFTISIDGVEDVATRIEGLYIEGNDNQTGVYNVNGQYMGRLEEIDNLPKGIYVVNGKKLVVK